MLTTCSTVEKAPGNSLDSSFSKFVECEHFSPSLRLLPLDGIESSMREDAVSIDNLEFEPFHKSWPYQKTASK